MKRVFALVVAIALTIGCAALAETVGFLYTLSDGEACITGYTGSDVDVAIPTELDGSAVTTIIGGAFLNNTEIVSVTVPVGVTYIGDGAFMGCSALQSVRIVSVDCAFGKLVYSGCPDDLVLIAPAGSIAQTFAQENGIAFEELAYSDADRYQQAVAALEAGDLEKAQELFSALGNYENSRDYYIYTTARIYERDGETEKADVLYALVGDFLDANARTNAQGRVSVSAVIGEGLGQRGKGGGSKNTIKDRVYTTPVPENASGGLMSFHEFTDSMPYEFEDTSKADGMYTIFYRIDSLDELMAYRKLFTDAGWSEYVDGPDEDGWYFAYMMAPDSDDSFFVAYDGEGTIAVLVYYAETDYGFDPIKGLY